VQHFDILEPDEHSKRIHRLKFYDRGAHHLHHSSVQNFQKTYSASGRPGSWWDWGWNTITESRGPNEPPIRANWLPFKMNRTYEMDLDNNAPYFFTAGLSGCTVVVAGDPQQPHAAHINRMENPDLPALMDRFRPQRPSDAATGYQDLRPDPTKAETTSRQVLMQEIKAAAAARAAGTGLRGANYARPPLGPGPVGGPRVGGNYIFGVVDFALHYQGPTPTDATANVVGYRNTATGNWHFVYQVFSSTGHEYYMREPLKCMICKAKVDYCTCPP